MAGAAQQEQEQNDAKGAKRGKRGLLIGAAIALVLAVGGGAWYMLGRAPADATVASATVRQPGVFVDLDPFTVNLADSGGERFAQVGLVLEVADTVSVTHIEKDMPRLRNEVLLLLSSKTGDELLTVAGKQALAAEIGTLAGAAAGWSPGTAGRTNPVAAVHFSKFIVQ